MYEILLPKTVYNKLLDILSNSKKIDELGSKF